jgi:hypothetical protein
MTKKLRHGSLFAGIVGFSRGRRKDFGHGTRLERCILRLSGVNYRLVAKSKREFRLS